MSAGVRPVSVTSVAARINEWTWLSLPVRISRRSVSLAGALLDGMYLSAWPLVGAFVLPIVFWLGLRLGWGQAVAGTLYIYSLGTMAVLVLVSQHSAATGFALWCGYALSDLFYVTPALPAWASSAKSFMPALASRALADMVLGILLVLIPVVARVLTRSGTAHVIAAVVRARASNPAARAPGGSLMSRDERLGLAVGMHAAMEFLLVYLWAQAAALLLQPFYVWQGAGPLTHGLVVTLRGAGWPLAAIAAYVGGVRIGLESAAETKPALALRRRHLRDALGQAFGGYRFSQGMIAAPLRALVLTFLLSGLINNSQPRAVAVFLAVSIVLWAREIAWARFGGTPRFLVQIPVVVRFLIALLISYLMATFIARSASGDSFVPGLIAAVASLVVFAVFLPAPRRLLPRRSAEPGTAR